MSVVDTKPELMYDEVGVSSNRSRVALRLRIGDNESIYALSREEAEGLGHSLLEAAKRVKRAGA